MDREEFWGRLADWLKGALKVRQPGRALVVGLSAPQGAGKTTLTREICRRLADQGITAASVSIDDFYLSRSDQVALSRRHQGNRYFQHRGLPGTHDVDFGTRTVRDLASATGPVRLPRYDKSKFGGQGDRASAGDWPVVAAPLDLVLFEGWMLGFRPIPDDRVADRHFGVVNRALSAYAAWTELLDAFIWLEPSDLRQVYVWRAEAEAKAIASGRSGMTPEDVELFVDSFLPAYETYLPGLREQPPIPGPYLHILIGGDRLPVAAM